MRDLTGVLGESVVIKCWDADAYVFMEGLWVVDVTLIYAPFQVPCDLREK